MTQAINLQEKEQDHYSPYTDQLSLLSKVLMVLLKYCR